VESLWQDIRFGLRMLWKTPGFTAVAIAALALGIGANTAMFSVVNAVVLRPLPFPEPNRLMAIFHEYPGIGIHHVSVSPITLDFYLKNQKSLESMGGFGGWGAPTNLTGSGEPQRLRTIGVTGGFFRALGVGAMTGRTITENDDQPGKNRVVVLGNGLWRRQFGADPSMVGKTITLDGNNYDVIGIMPASFDYPSKSDLWVPMGMTAEQWQRGVDFLLVKITNRKLTSTMLKELLAKERILVRDCCTFMGMDDSYFRVTIRSAKDNQILVENIKRVLSTIDQ
jgi:ABC-type antimicrobial peptide transport system permease subunit